MGIITKQKVSPKGKLNAEDLARLGKNFLKFVAPTLVIFFSLLAQGVELQKAWPVAAFALYQSISDFFSKLNDSSK